MSDTDEDVLQIFFKERELNGDFISRALLRKYDGNWEMKVEDDNTSVGLWWKGQSVSFCSLWKLDGNYKTSTFTS